MKTSRPQILRLNSAFTLIELLVVIAIIAILAGMLLPAIGIAKVKAQVAQAKADIKNIELGVKGYDGDYNGRLPAPGIPTGVQDVTYGYVTNPPVAGHYALAGNADVMAVLFDLETFANGNATTNKGHVFNPRNLIRANARAARDATSAGIGPDGEYRDPWGNSYVISMDTSLNDRCRDSFYSRQSVSQDAGQKGIYGMFNPTAPGNSNEYEYNGQYLIWSRGPDGQANPLDKANKGVNRDNVLGWQ